MIIDPREEFFDSIQVHMMLAIVASRAENVSYYILTLDFQVSFFEIIKSKRFKPRETTLLKIIIFNYSTF